MLVWLRKLMPFSSGVDAGEHVGDRGDGDDDEQKTGIALGMPKTAFSPRGDLQSAQPQRDGDAEQGGQDRDDVDRLADWLSTRSPISGRNTMLICRFVMPLR